MAMTASGTERCDEADLVVLDLVGLISRETWSAEAAAAGLLTKQHSRDALERARCRVSRARAEGRTRITERAEATMDKVLARYDHAGPPAGLSATNESGT